MDDWHHTGSHHRLCRHIWGIYSLSHILLSTLCLTYCAKLYVHWSTLRLVNIIGESTWWEQHPFHWQCGGIWMGTKDKEVRPLVGSMFCLLQYFNTLVLLTVGTCMMQPIKSLCHLASKFLCRNKWNKKTKGQPANPCSLFTWKTPV